MDLETSKGVPNRLTIEFTSLERETLNYERYHHTRSCTWVPFPFNQGLQRILLGARSKIILIR